MTYEDVNNHPKPADSPRDLLAAPEWMGRGWQVSQGEVLCIVLWLLNGFDCI